MDVSLLFAVVTAVLFKSEGDELADAPKVIADSVGVVVGQSIRLSITHSLLFPSHVAALSRDLRH
jgi:hypothetical protein